MKFQRIGTVAVGLLLLVYGASVTVLGLGDGPTEAVVGTAILALAGGVFLIAGLLASVERVDTTRSWSQLMGVGTVLLALGWMVTAWPLARDQPVFGVIVVTGGLALAFIGFQGITDGPHFDFESESLSRRGVLILGVTLAIWVLAILLAILF